MRSFKRENIAPLICGLLLASLLVIIGWQFTSATQTSVIEARDRIIATHNDIARLPQPIDIDLGVQSGSIMGQLGNYQTAEKTYEDLTFHAPSPTRQKIAGWLTFNNIPNAQLNAEDLANDYEGFIRTYPALLAALEKPLVYDPGTDLQELAPESDEFQQRVVNAGEGLSSAQKKINELQLPATTKDAINHELTALINASQTLLENGSLSAWGEQVETSQTTIQEAMQDYWSEHIAALSKRKQQLVSHYTHFYQ